MKKKHIGVVIADIIILAVMISAVVATNIFSPILTSFLGTVGGSSNEAGGEYRTYTTDDELETARRDMGKTIVEEGAVLLRNENNALPLSSGMKVSVFGQHAHEILASGSGSGSIGDPEQNLKEVLEDAGFEVNGTLWDFYLNNGGKSLGNGPALTGGNSETDWSVNECPQSDYTSEVKDSYKDYSDAAIVVVSRTGGEGGDLAMDMSAYGGTADEHYLELSAEEKELMEAVSTSFDKVIVLLNTNNPMELGFLEDYDIDACMYIGGVGMSGLNGVGPLLNGEISPSGHLADTYVYDNFSAPSSQNFGDYTYTNSDYKYVVYAEGIYVGYRYYETRYADTVMGADTSGYDYDNTVLYPFGYGLSYTTFEWRDFKVDYNSEEDTFTASVTVENNGDTAGKDVVEIYFSAPYEHGVTTIEKSAVELAGFAKTETLEPGASETVEITFNKDDLASYDAGNAKTYVLEEGEYWFTAATDAHEAVNNVLKAEGYDVEGTDLVSSYTQTSTDTTTYAVDSATGTEITNLFDYASFDGMETLSRENWAKVEEGLAYDSLEISAEDKAQADLTGKEASRNPDIESAPDSVIVGSEGTLQLSEMAGADYDDERWQTLIEEIGQKDLEKLFATAGYATIEIANIGKPRTADLDGPGGISSFVGGASSVDAFGYPTETVLACTWNEKLAEEFGEMVGEESLAAGVNGWYAPGMDTHRSVFGGRNFEYYSEDGLIAGKMGAAVVRGCASKGLYCYIKHFALNEQDTNRGPELHTWADEQAMREIYLEPFEISVKEGNASALMTSLNCIGVTSAVGDYNLIQKLLKDEWGFKGMVITDYLGYDENLILQILYAGGDCVLSTYGMFSNADNTTIAQLQRAAHNVLYTVANSNAMYTIGEEGVQSALPVYKVILYALEAVLALVLVVINLRAFKPKKKQTA